MEDDEQDVEKRKVEKLKQKVNEKKRRDWEGRKEGGGRQEGRRAYAFAYARFACASKVGGLAVAGAC